MYDCHHLLQSASCVRRDAVVTRGALCLGGSACDVGPEAQAEAAGVDTQAYIVGSDLHSCVRHSSGAYRVTTARVTPAEGTHVRFFVHGLTIMSTTAPSRH
jgi:hypothetical protein